VKGPFGGKIVSCHPKEANLGKRSMLSAQIEFVCYLPREANLEVSTHREDVCHVYLGQCSP
jgi:hypothetical protein